MSSYVERPRTACALSGALAAISALPGVVAISHSSVGCGGNLSSSASMGAGYCGSSYCSGASVPVSAITETEIVFGGADRLGEEIASSLELIDAELFIVATGCMAELIADDVEGIVNGFQKNEKPIIQISTPSFKGDSCSGYEILLEGIFNHFLKKSEIKDPNLVNIFGVVPLFDPFFRGNLEEIKRLLELAGLKVNTFFTPDQTYGNILSASKASLNIVLSPIWGVDFVRNFEKIHGTPYLIANLPVGPQATDQFLCKVTETMGLDKRVTEAVIERENRVYYRYFERSVDLIADAEFRYYAAVIANANNALPYAQFLEQELGWNPNDVFVTDLADDERKAAVAAAFAQSGLKGNLQFETDTSIIAKRLRKNHAQNNGQMFYDEYAPVYILGSTFDLDYAAKQAKACLCVSYPVYNRMIIDRGYAGYRGGLHLVEDLIGILVQNR